MVENSTKARKWPFNWKQLILLYLVCSVISYGIILILNTPVPPSRTDYLAGFGSGAAMMGLCMESALVTMYIAICAILKMIIRRNSSAPEANMAAGLLRWGGLTMLFLLAIAYCFPSYFGALIKEREAYQRGQLREVQIVAEAYAEKHHHYPASIDDSFKSSFPNGTPPLNIFTQKKEWPIIGQIKNVEQAREEAPGPLAPGVVEYSPLFDATGQPCGYAIRVGAKDGTALRGPRGTFVLSNETP